MAPDSVPEIPNDAPHKQEASSVLTILNLQLRFIISLIEMKIEQADVKSVPTTFQVWRFLIGETRGAIGSLEAMLKDAEVQLADQPADWTGFTYEGVADIIDTAEIRVEKCMFGPFALDDLPPGNPGEKEFERLLKPKIALNRSYTQFMHKLANLHTALFSDTYRLDISEEARVAAWRKSRKEKLEATLKDIERLFAENEAYLKGLNEAKAAVLERIEGNEQMTFDTEIDVIKTPETGDEP